LVFATVKKSPMPDRFRAPLCAFALPLALSLPACRPKSQPPDPADVVVVALPQVEPLAEQRKNMIWIPPGTFIAGTPPDRLPRIADAELAGVPITLHGFYVDQFPFPNEAGAIQTTNLTREQARQSCQQADKRLCTELEWERACKGPLSTTYEFGNSWRPDECGSGSRVILPTGARVGCRSAFDVHDLHGGAAEWTDSPWGRGESRPLVTLRGGSGNPAEVTARCAHATASRPDTKRSDIGFRCCAGDLNDAVVEIEVSRPADPFVSLSFDRELALALSAILPRDRLRTTSAPFQIDRIWRWFPIGNEELLVGAGCARAGPGASCGIVVARPPKQSPRFLAFASSSGWVPLVKIDDDRRTVWLYGVDDRGQFRRRVEYLWGRVGVGDEDRAGDPRKKKQHAD
jgi:hypothetical protein